MSKFDVFISFKNTGADGEKTQDYYMAKDLYDALNSNGIQVFFSPESIRKNTVYNYSEYINSAIESSDILIAVGSSEDNFRSKWVNYELTSFHNEFLSGRKDDSRSGMISYVSEKVNIDKIPLFLRSCEVFTELNVIVEWVKNRIRSSDRLIARFAQEKIQKEITSISPGSYLLDHYRIQKVIGRGGMSTVYLATDEFCNRQVAVKVAEKGNMLDFGSVVQALNAEVGIMKRLVHPFLPRIYDVIEKPETMIIIMDLIEGQSAKSILEEYGAMPEEKVIKIGRQLCEVLQYLHQMSPPIIYRDMKPANVMVRSNGDVMLIDFGTARYFKEGKLADTISLGTLGYAAPEQFGGMGQTDARTDIYGLGVTLYHLITDMNPSEPPYEIKPIREINPALSKALEYIIVKATQRDPNERYQSVGEMLYDLNNLNKVKVSRGSFLSSFFKRKKNGKEKPQKEHQRSVPQAVEKKINEIMPKLVEANCDLGSGATTILSSDAYPKTKELTTEEKLRTALSLFKVSEATDLLNSVAAVCISMPDKITNDAGNSIYLYFFTVTNIERVKKQIVESGLGANVKNEKLVLIPKDSIVSVQLITDQIRFEKSTINYQWNGRMCYSSIRIEKILSTEQTIPVMANIKVDGKDMRSVSFNISK